MMSRDLESPDQCIAQTMQIACEAGRHGDNSKISRPNAAVKEYVPMNRVDRT